MERLIGEESGFHGVSCGYYGQVAEKRVLGEKTRPALHSPARDWTDPRKTSQSLNLSWAGSSVEGQEETRALFLLSLVSAAISSIVMQKQRAV